MTVSAVFGGGGFLGSHLVDLLVSKGHDVVVVDNFHTGDEENLEKALASERVQVLRHDISTPLSIDADRIYNLASPASPVQYQTNPVQTMKTNVLGTLNLLELARSKNARFFQASTSEVYGDPDVSPQYETYFGNVNPIGIRACYDEGKRAAETLSFDFHRQYGVDIRVARIFNTYGPRMSPDDGRVVSTFIRQALSGEKITIFGDGSQTRSFCFVEDLVAGIERVMEYGDANISPVNIGNPHEINLNSLAKTIIELTQSNSEIEYLSLPGDDPRRRCPDISKITSLTDWSPAISLRDGLTETISDLKHVLAANR